MKLQLLWPLNIKLQVLWVKWRLLPLLPRLKISAHRFCRPKNQRRLLSNTGGAPSSSRLHVLTPGLTLWASSSSPIALLRVILFYFLLSICHHLNFFYFFIGIWAPCLTPDCKIHKHRYNVYLFPIWIPGNLEQGLAHGRQSVAVESIDELEDPFSVSALTGSCKNDT